MRVIDHSLAIFLMAGFALFLLTGGSTRDDPVTLDPVVLEGRVAAEAARRGVRELSDAERADVRARMIEDELLYREALRLQLDADDALVRQRLIQKVLFLAEDLGGASAPMGDADIEAYYTSNPERWRVEPTTSLIHVYFAARPEAELLQVLSGRYADATTPPPLGDAFAGPRAVVATDAELTAMFGIEATRSIGRIEAGGWSSDPVVSRFGWHYVRVLDRRPGRVPSLEEVRKTLELAYLVDRKESAVRRFIQDARERYGVASSEPLARPRVAPEMTE